jgi:tetratricopeptide (TPR) repeat protein
VGGLEFFEKARDNYERNLPEDDERLGGLYNNMALALTSCGRYDEALDMFAAALRVMEKQEHGEPEQAITLLNMADALEAELGPEGAAEAAEGYLDRAAELLDTPDLPRNGYYAFVCEKCAPVFGHYGYFAAEEELRKRAKEIQENHEGA